MLFSSRFHETKSRVFWCRFKDTELEISAVAQVDPFSGLNEFYEGCSTEAPCEVRFFGNRSQPENTVGANVPFTYGSQKIQMQCWYTFNIHLRIVREMIAWPLLMLAVVVFCTVAVYLVLKRMSTAEKDVDEREKVHAKLREAKVVAEAADTAKSSFLATVSHEIRQIGFTLLSCHDALPL